ncbi:VanW family protein [Oscillospiraceae bacterium OttesenSCG-928-G22]|nr:VanW family protein [Oscillospiraceae bacterium OttesenSCG-928-G22]
MRYDRYVSALLLSLFLFLTACASPAAPSASVSPSAPPASESKRPSASPSAEPKRPARAAATEAPAPSATPEPTATPKPEPTKPPAPTVKPGDVFASFQTTIYDKRKGRINNIVVCAKAVNGTVVGAGETFSFNQTVGPRTAAKGYKEAPVFYTDGKEDTIGGGICQNSTTLFMAAKRAKLKIVERHQHMYKLDYIELGNDATVFYGHLDFRFRNVYDFPIVIGMSVKGGTVTATIARANS